MERFHHGHGGHGGAVGVGDDTQLRLVDILRVDLGDDQRHTRIHAPGRGVVDDGGSGPGDLRGPLLRGATTGGEQGHVDAAEIRCGDVLHYDLAIAPGQGLARGTLGGEVADLVDGIVPLRQQCAHHAADLTSGSKNSNSHGPILEEQPVPVARSTPVG